jgi:peptide/nickel transport system ATP-binding protein
MTTLAEKPPTALGAPALDVDGLSIGYADGPDAVSDVSLEVGAGEILGIIGESGCGKSSIGLSLLGLLPGSARVRARRFTVAGHDVVGRDDRDLQSLRGRDVSMIFQEPMNALNPLMRIGDQITEILALHQRGGDKAGRRARALELLRLVQVPEPELRLRQFPHQMSGGMRQRVMIAIAMAVEPRLLVADEPTTALDVTVQAQILTLLKELRDRTGTSIVLVSHDLGVIAQTCDRVVVMYAGQVIEEGTPAEVLASPGHPYTEGLLASMPGIDRPARTELPTIVGGISAKDRARTGCRFATRCPLAGPECEAPQRLRITGPDRTVRCVRADGLSGEPLTVSTDPTLPTAKEVAR